MKNMECAVAVLAAHREARQWDDNAVARDMLSQLGLDPEGEAANPTKVVDPDEELAKAADAEAKAATERAEAARARLAAKELAATQPPPKLTRKADDEPKAEEKPEDKPKAEEPATSDEPPPPEPLPGVADAREPDESKPATEEAKGHPVLEPPPAVGGPGSGPPGARPV